MDFPTFLPKAWDILEPANPLIHDWYIDLICEHLQLVTEGIIQRLVINIPPRFAKSKIVTTLWPVWSWTQKAYLRFIFCSYSGSLSVKHSVDRRNVIECDWFKRNWGNVVQLSEDQNQKNEYSNTSRGHMIATSVGGTGTGKGGDVIVEDDMLNPQEAESQASRDHSISMHKNVLSSRLDNPKTGCRVIVEQRTHSKDLTGHVLENEKGWKHLCLPMRAEKKTIITFPVSQTELVREEGALLNPQRMGEKEVDQMKHDMGTRTFVAQCQQNPTSEEGNIFKRQWWKYWHEPPKGAEATIQSWDMSFKETKSGSYVVGQVWKKRGANFYLMDQWRKRVDFAEVIPAMLAFKGNHMETSAILIEDAANGPAITSQLQNRIPGIILIKPQGSKIARAQAVAPFVEAGNVILPSPDIAPWVYDYIEECAAFKGATGEINDQVDGTSQALSWLDGLGYQQGKQDESDVEWLGHDEMEGTGGFS
jgi:predicted phage terminase large subunit-like protein